MKISTQSLKKTDVSEIRLSSFEVKQANSRSVQRYRGRLSIIGFHRYWMSLSGGSAGRQGESSPDRIWSALHLTQALKRIATPLQPIHYVFIASSPNKIDLKSTLTFGCKPCLLPVIRCDFAGQWRRAVKTQLATIILPGVILMGNLSRSQYLRQDG
ncbi:hypothetical protein J6590_003527 [Homalodisca vitripennis]|nr:hypothetical protein J6590_003527 [Homalodisca vitripennis]